MSGSVGNHSTNILPAQDPMFVPPRAARGPQLARTAVASQLHRGEDHVPHAPGSETGTRRTADAATAVESGVATGRASVPSAQPGAGPVPDLLAAAGAYLAQPALVVITGPPGVGRSTLLRRLGAAFRGPVFSGGGLAMLRGMPGLPLARAVRARLPVHDPALLAEAVKSRVRQGLLLLDDLQWADPLTVAALPEIAAHCRIAVTLRTPHRLPGDAEVRLRTVAAAWLPVPPLPPPAAAALVRQLAPGTSAGAVAEVVRRAGGVPLAVTALARHLATARPEPDSTSELRLAEPRIEPPVEGLGYAVATALADLARPARQPRPARSAPASTTWSRPGSRTSSTAWWRRPPRTSPSSRPACSKPAN